TTWNRTPPGPGRTCCCAMHWSARARWRLPRWRSGSASHSPPCGRAMDFSFLDEDIEVRSQELQMAASLIDSMTVEFDPSEYRDNYREALAELVNAKAEGRDLVQPE